MADDTHRPWARTPASPPAEAVEAERDPVAQDHGVPRHTIRDGATRHCG